MKAPTLIFGWGNPSRGDDALGPLFVERLAEQAARHPEWGDIEFLTDFQLQVEHALDLLDRRRVLFADARRGMTQPCALERIEARRDASFTTHAMSAQAVLQVYADTQEKPLPPVWLLSIRGESFELGEALSVVANTALEESIAAAVQWLTPPHRSP